MLALDKQELLVLFELCHRICETNKFAASHPAEIVVVDKITGELERSLAEPFLENYPEILEGARNAILGKYQDKMGKSAWVEKVDLEQT